MSEFASQSAKDAQASNYGGPSYWKMLEATAWRHHYYFTNTERRSGSCSVAQITTAVDVDDLDGNVTSHYLNCNVKSREIWEGRRTEA